MEKILFRFTTTSCWLRGSDDILKLCKKHLSIENNQTTKDGLFTLKEVECLGACVNAPMIQINDNYYEELNKDSLLNILNKLKEGKEVNIGPQTKKERELNLLIQLTIKCSIKKIEFLIIYMV